jgi:hypothetical protein
VTDVHVTVELLALCRQRLGAGRTEFVDAAAKLIRLHAAPMVQDNSFQTVQHSDLLARCLREISAFLIADASAASAGTDSAATSAAPAPVHLHVQLAAADTLRLFVSRGRREGPPLAPGDAALPPRKGLVAVTAEPVGYRLALLADIPRVVVRSIHALNSLVAANGADAGNGNGPTHSGNSSPTASVTGAFSTFQPRANASYDPSSSSSASSASSAVPPAPPAAAVLEALVAAARDLALAESGALALVGSGCCACVAPLLRHDTQVCSYCTPHIWNR